VQLNEAMPRPVRCSLNRRRVGSILATAILLAGCGSSSGTDSDAAGPAAREVVDIPDVPVQDVETGAEISLTSIVPAEQPVLLWFWAPH
jgi:PBP1b-binding outer membrane lipoprotein LpoB